MEIKAKIERLEKVLSDNDIFYQIPDYQRPYSWDKENISDLIDDLVDAYANKSEDNYFCGSIVVVPDKNSNRYDVIDGQQRLTTFTILARVIYDFYSNEKFSPKANDLLKNSISDKYEENKRKLKLLTDNKHQVDFDSTVLSGIVFLQGKNQDKGLKDNIYLRNAHYIKDFITSKISFDKIDSFILWLYKSVVMTVIECPDQDSAIKIFNVLNNRGLPLSPVDILKSSLMNSFSSDEKDDRNAFKRKWESIIDYLGFSNIDIDDMLNSYLYFKLASNPKTRMDKELIEIYRKDNTTPLSAIDEIDKYSKAYVEAITGKDKRIYALRYLGHKVYWTTIVATAIFMKYSEKDALISMLLSYYYVNWIAGATVARIKQPSFNIIKSIKDKSDLTDINTLLEDSMRKYSTFDSFCEEVVSEYTYGKAWVKPLLLLIEYYSQEDSIVSNFIPITDKLHLEHVLPQTATDYWTNIFNEEERETWTNSIANLVLMSWKKNIQAKNYTFDEKKDVYMDANNVSTAFITTRKVMDNTRWTAESLIDREQKLISSLKTIFPHFGICDYS